MYLFDTDAVSQIIRKDPSMSFIRRLAAVRPEHQYTSAITVGELSYGAYKSARPEYFLEKLEQLVWPNISVLPFDEGPAKIYGRLRAALERKGTALSEPDLRIAAIALHNELVVVTGNTRHFSRIPGIRIENWL